jgi:frataxin-like iron-binding protein CyaY
LRYGIVHIEDLMHTMMDNNDLLLTAEECFEEISKAIDTLALDSVYAYVEDGQLEIQFNDQSRILAKGDEATGELILDAPKHHYRFYYDDVDEKWFSKDQEQRFESVVEKLIAAHVDAAISLNIDD